MTFKELDTVKLTKNFPEYKLKENEAGVILECFSNPDEAYLVEFSGKDGEAICTEIFKHQDLIKK